MKKEVHAHVKTTADTKGARQADEAIDRVTHSLEKVSHKQRVADRAARRFGEGSRAAEKGQRNLGLATLEASRAFEDAQYGMRGVLNNIPQLVMMLGMSGGLAGAISIVAVGATMLGPKLMQLGGSAERTARMVGAAEAIMADQQERAIIAAEKAAKKRKEEIAQIGARTEAITKAADDAVEAIDREEAAYKRRNQAAQELDDINKRIELAKIDADPAFQNDEVARLQARQAVEQRYRERERQREMEAIDKDRAAAAARLQSRGREYAENDNRALQLDGEAAGLRDDETVAAIKRRLEEAKAQAEAQAGIIGKLRDSMQVPEDNVAAAKYLAQSDLVRDREIERVRYKGLFADNSKEAGAVENLAVAGKMIAVLEAELLAAEQEAKKRAELEARAKEARKAAEAARKEAEKERRRIEEINAGVPAVVRKQKAEDQLTEITTTAEQKAAEEKAAAEAARRQAEADKQAEAASREGSGAATAVGRAVKGLGLSEDFQRRLDLAIGATADGSTADELQRVTRLLDQVISALERRGRTPGTDPAAQKLGLLEQRMRTVESQLRNTRE